MRTLRSMVVAGLGLALLSVAPVVSAAPASPESAPYALVNGDIKSGTLKLTLSSEFSQQLLNAGATVTGIGGAVAMVDEATGATVIRFRVEPKEDGFSLTPAIANAYVVPRGGLRITGNNTSVDLADWVFSFSEAYGMMISATAGDLRPWVASGVPITLPHKLRKSRLIFTSPPITLTDTVTESLDDVLRGPQNAAGQFTGPVPSFTTEQIPFGIADVNLKVGR